MNLHAPRPARAPKAVAKRQTATKTAAPTSPFHKNGGGREFQERRKALGLKTAKIAGPLFEVSPNQVAQWESGRTVPAKAWRLLAAYESGFRPPDWPLNEPV